MSGRYSLASVAALMGEPSRAAILLALLDGRALPAGELARAAHVSASAASLHLAKLTSGGLLVVRQDGRHRYYALASADVAHALEALGVIASPPPPPRALSPERAAVRAARTCYDHLAGAASVALAHALEEREILGAKDAKNYAVTRAGARWFADALQIDVDALSDGRRSFARRCLDWTERRPHIAGALGAALLDRFVALRWIKRHAGTRAVTITPRGRAGLAELSRRGAPKSDGSTEPV